MTRFLLYGLCALAMPAAWAASPVPFAQARQVIAERCTVCHSASPSSDLFNAAPAGVMFDTPEQMHQDAARIEALAVSSRIMPLGNVTGMTDAERELIGQWVHEGAPTH